jgi:hypothetical protein
MALAKLNRSALTEEFENAPFPLEYCLERLPEVVADCAKEKTYWSAVDACMMSRHAWAAYFDRFVFDPQLMSSDHQERLKSGLDACLKAVRLVDRFDEAEEDDQKEKLKLYARNIQCRLDLLRTLHTDGKEAALREMEKRAAGLKEQLAKRLGM